ncbi:uncharacterized protein SCHCODRAFT_02684172 [Schizophyllum commune H4-8]|uniref:Uncharacterized protein n=1 Tax=Schizophyllum commune (strain H4-8 / FGSC 9210) TaxID=578458 RepID=D8PRW0_SCHCM|nr:uncharacterized protein SCHCODRAFT_02684172 [Schizophyllum commune H4-8]KAI5897896.1 hypothetical protein SCHCODRAFT_02684172 [Schizophyllum commune H4-8]
MPRTYHTAQPKGKRVTDKSLSNLRRGSAPRLPPPPSHGKENANPTKQISQLKTSLKRTSDRLVKVTQQLKGKNRQLKTEKQGRRRTEAGKRTLALQIQRLRDVEIPSLQVQLATKAMDASFWKEAYESSERGRRGDRGHIRDLRSAVQKAVARTLKTEKRADRLDAGMARAIVAAEKRVEKAIQTRGENALFNKGLFTRAARSLTRLITQSGCAEKHVGKVLQAMGGAYGFKLKRRMAQSTVRCIITEGLIASEMQSGYEHARAEHIPDLTFSSDSTSHLKVNYDSRFTAIRVPDYTSAEGIDDQYAQNPIHRLRSLGLTHSTSHHSEVQVVGTQQKIMAIAETFTESPLAGNSGQSFDSDQFATKMVACNGDHASDVRKAERMYFDWKIRVNSFKLGEKARLEMPVPELANLFLEAKLKRIADLGGLIAWQTMSEGDQDELDIEIMDALTTVLGGKAYEALPVAEKDEMDRFLWAGCVMHKDLNTVKGGAKGMEAYWASHNLAGPVLLPNKDNAAVLASGETPHPTAAQTRATEASTRGGVKATQLGGLICRNKDDKKGQQDIFRWFFRRTVGHEVAYPDTSNTRYQSHCSAAAVLLAYLDVFKQFLVFVRDRKEKPGWTNIEFNFWNALHDDSTLCELVALTVYGQAISHPYMREVRGPGTEHVNMLDLGDLHHRIPTHMRDLIQQPALIFGTEATHKTGSLDSKPWFFPEAMVAVRVLAARLEHAEKVTAAFLQAAVVTFERFAAEFADGGKIASLTVEDRQKLWIPATNDVNEGALGTYRQEMRRKPRMTLLQFNARFIFHRNNTQEFMDRMLTEEDEKYIRKKARQRLAMGLERQRQEEQMEVDEKRAEETRRKEMEQERARAEKLARVMSITIVLDPGLVKEKKFTLPMIDEQLDAHRLFDLEVPIKAHTGTKKAQRLEVLLGAIRRYKSRALTSQEDPGKGGR